MRLALAMLLCSCAGWAATPKAGFERVAAGRLEHCIQNNLCQYALECFEDSRGFCVDAGYSKTCGQMEAEGSCGSKLK